MGTLGITLLGACFGRHSAYPQKSSSSSLRFRRTYPSGGGVLVGVRRWLAFNDGGDDGGTAASCAWSRACCAARASNRSTNPPSSVRTCDGAVTSSCFLRSRRYANTLIFPWRFSRLGSFESSQEPGVEMLNTVEGSNTMHESPSLTNESSLCHRPLMCRPSNGWRS